MPAASANSGNAPNPQCWRVLGIALIAVCGGGYANAQSNHPVTISIVATGTSPLPAGTCTTQQGYVICVSEDPIDLSKDVRPVTISWAVDVTSAGWTFVKNKGIEIKKGQWRWVTKSDSQYAAEQKKKDGIIYKYAINVNMTNAAGVTTTLGWDPTIKND